MGRAEVQGGFGGHSGPFVGVVKRLPEDVLSSGSGSGSGSSLGLGFGWKRQSLLGCLWRSACGSGRWCGVGGVGGLVERLVLIQFLLEQICLERWQSRWGDGRWGGWDAEVVQDPGDRGGCCDQCQQDHLGLAAGTFEPVDTEASFEQARPG